MDTIYSRRRIKISKTKWGYTKKKNAKKIFSIFVILLITIYTFYNFFSCLNPIFEELCIEKARTLGTSIVNNASNIILDNMDYKNIVTIEEKGGERFLKTDVVVINKIASDIALEAEKQFKELENEEIQIPIGAITGIKYLTGIRTKYKYTSNSYGKYFNRNKK